MWLGWTLSVFFWWGRASDYFVCFLLFYTLRQRGSGGVLGFVEYSIPTCLGERDSARWVVAILPEKQTLQ